VCSPLSCRQPCDRVSQGAPPREQRIEVRAVGGNGFVLRPEGGLGRCPPAAAAQPVDDPSSGDRQQPRPERPARIVGVANGVDGEEHVLHDVLDLPDQHGMPRRQGTEIRGDVLEQPPVGDLIAGLRARHQLGPGQ